MVIYYRYRAPAFRRIQAGLMIYLSVPQIFLHLIIDNTLSAVIVYNTNCKYLIAYYFFVKIKGQNKSGVRFENTIIECGGLPRQYPYNNSQTYISQTYIDFAGIF